MCCAPRIGLCHLRSGGFKLYTFVTETVQNCYNNLNLVWISRFEQDKIVLGGISTS